MTGAELVNEKASLEAKRPIASGSLDFLWGVMAGRSNFDGRMTSEDSEDCGVVGVDSALARAGSLGVIVGSLGVMGSMGIMGSMGEVVDALGLVMGALGSSIIASL